MHANQSTMGKPLLLLLLPLFVATSCGRRGSAPTPTDPPAKATPRPGETSLSTVTLSADAEKRLGIEFATVEKRVIPNSMAVPGEVIVPTGGSVTLTAPFSATASTRAMPKVGTMVKKGQTLLDLSPFAAPDRDVRAQAEKSVAIASAQLATVTTRVERLEKLVPEGGASPKQLEEARAERDILKAELGAAEKRLGAIRKAPLGSDVSIPLRAPRDGLLRSVSVAPGQIVSAGAPLFEILGAPTLWVRASVYAGEAPSIQVEASARIVTLGTTSTGDNSTVALPISAPPSADPISAAVDFYYELPPLTPRRPGERVTVFLSTNHPAEALVVPFSSVVFDALGGAWIYAEKAEHVYERRRIDIARIEDDLAVLAQGPAASTRIVRAGTSELFGVEFGVGK